MSVHEKCTQCLDNSTPEQVFKSLVRKDSDKNYYVPLKINLCDPDDSPVECISDFTWIELLKSLLVVNSCDQCSIKVAIDSSSLDLICPPPLPDDFDVKWQDDFARVTFTDKSGGESEHELWESVDGGSYSLVYTFPPGVSSYDYYTWQNANLNFKLRARHGVQFSSFTTSVNLISPIVLRTDQSILHTIFIEHIWVAGGYTVNIDWGDGTDIDCVGHTDDITKNYAGVGDYWITLSGDTDKITMIDWPCLGEIIYGDLSKLKIPSSMVMWHFFGHSLLTGYISDWDLPSGLQVLHIGSCNYYGDVSGWDLPNGLYDFHISGNELTGYISSWTIPVTLAHFVISSNHLTGDMSSLVMPNSSVYGTVIMDISNNDFTGDVSSYTMDSKLIEFNISYNLFTGDLSGCIIPVGTANIKILAQAGPKITKMPRGNFRWVSQFDFSANNCNTAEIDDLLADIDSYFSGGVVPLTNCVYTLNGTGMGVPSAAGLVSRASIIAKYVAEGKTCTITVN